MWSNDSVHRSTVLPFSLMLEGLQEHESAVAWIYLKDADIQVAALPSQPLRLLTSGLIHIMISTCCERRRYLSAGSTWAATCKKWKRTKRSGCSTKAKSITELAILVQCIWVAYEQPINTIYLALAQEKHPFIRLCMYVCILTDTRNLSDVLVQ